MLKTIIVALIGGGFVAGCTCPIQKRANSAPEPVNESPLVVDGAMQLRDWDRSVAVYQNGDTIAFPTGFLYEPKWGQPEYHYYFIETPLFIGQTLGMPIVFVMTPPWTPTTYTGVTVGQTYTAMPVLPPSVAVTAEAPSEPEPAPIPGAPPVPMEVAPPVEPTTQPS